MNPYQSPQGHLRPSRYTRQQYRWRDRLALLLLLWGIGISGTGGLELLAIWLFGLTAENHLWHRLILWVTLSGVGVFVLGTTYSVYIDRRKPEETNANTTDPDA